MITQFLSVFPPHLSGLLIITTAVGRTLYITYSKNIACDLSQKKSVHYLIFLLAFIAFLIGITHTLSTIHSNFHQVNIIILTLDLMLILIGLLSYLCLYRKVVNYVKKSSNIGRAKSVSRNSEHKKIYSEAVSMTRIINRLIFVLCMSYIPYISFGLVFSS